MSYQHRTTEPEPIGTGVRIVDYGREYIPASIGGREVTYLRSDDGTVIRIAGREWAYDLEVTAKAWEGRIPHRDQTDVTWMTKVRHSGSTHRQIVAWWRDELAGLHRDGAAA